MAPPVPPGSALWDVLSSAALQVERDADLVREDAVSPQEVSNITAGLVAAVRQIVDGAAPPAGIAASTLSRRLVVGLRRSFIEAAGALHPAPDPDALIAILTALEGLGTALEPAWHERFTDRLSGPDGLELVVEVAHDLRSPLTSILFLAETLLRGRSGPVTPLQERQLGLVYSAAFGLSSVASDVVELVRGRDRLSDLEPMPFSVNDIFESVRDIVRPIAEEKGLEVRVRVPERPLRIGHPVALNRVLLNLVTNALKFTDQGHVELEAVEREGEGGQIRFSVRDTGRGIPPRAMELLFEPFRRRQRDREYAFSGSGLGLSICRRLVEAMDSELQVETELGQGTRFHFALSLPVAGMTEPDAAASSRI